MHQFSITDEMIGNGVRANKCNCPTAMALEAGGFQSAWVDACRVVGRIDGFLVWAALPEKVSRFVTAFDKNEEVEPLDFSLRLKVDVYCPDCDTVQTITWKDAQTGECQICPKAAVSWLKRLQERHRP